MHEIANMPVMPGVPQMPSAEHYAQLSGKMKERGGRSKKRHHSTTKMSGSRGRKNERFTTMNNMMNYSPQRMAYN